MSINACQKKPTNLFRHNDGRANTIASLSNSYKDTRFMVASNRLSVVWRKNIFYHKPMSEQVNIHFYAELNELLPTAWRDTRFNYEIKKTRSVKDLIESIGVPHPEVDLIFIGNKSVDFNYPVEGGEDIRIYPPTIKLDKSSLVHNHPQPLAEPRFLLDVHLGRLATYLRMLGFDTLYRNDYDDPELADISANQKRILLTCDRKLLMRKQISYGYLVRSRNPREQIDEVLKRFELFHYQATIARCLQCNGIIKVVAKQKIESRLLPLTRKHYDRFYQCDSCRKIYWEGSHFGKMQKLIKKIKIHQ